MITIQIDALGFQHINWNNIEKKEYGGIKGKAIWQTFHYGNIRIRKVEYTPNYIADHWCYKGHILFILKGEMKTELYDGRVVFMMENMSYHVGDNDTPHRSSSDKGALLFIVD